LQGKRLAQAQAPPERNLTMNTIPLAEYLANPKAYSPESLKMIDDLQKHRQFVCGYYPNAVQTVTHKKDHGYFVVIVDVPLALNHRALIDTRNAKAPQALSATFNYQTIGFDTMHAPAAWANAALRIAKLL
jgi:hypothetical protein